MMIDHTDNSMFGSPSMIHDSSINEESNHAIAYMVEPLPSNTLALTAMAATAAHQALTQFMVTTFLWAAGLDNNLINVDAKKNDSLLKEEEPRQRRWQVSSLYAFLHDCYNQIEEIKADLLKELH